MNEQVWGRLKRQAREALAASNRAISVLGMSWSEVNKYPHAVEAKAVEKSYLDFLNEQIELGARGEDWTNVLKRREAALAAYIGKQLATLLISSTEGTLTMKFRPDDLGLVLAEWNE